MRNRRPSAHPASKATPSSWRSRPSQWPAFGSKRNRPASDKPDDALPPAGSGGASIHLGIDLQLVSTGARLFGNGQDGNVTITPIIFVIPEPGDTALFAAAWAALAALRLRNREPSRIDACLL